MNACRQIEIMVGLEFVAKGKDLPVTWGEIPTIQRMQRESQAEYVDTSSINLMRCLNSFAIVPNTPVISSEPGISRKRSTKRLFAISRYKNRAFEDASGQAEGRYAVLVSNDGTITEPHWIPEHEANIIFSQIGGLDPSYQPVPFPDIDRISKLSEERKEKALEVIRDHYREEAAREKKERPMQNLFHRDGLIESWGWLAAGSLTLVALGVFGYVAMRQRVKR